MLNGMAFRWLSQNAQHANFCKKVRNRIMPQKPHSNYPPQIAFDDIEHLLLGALLDYQHRLNDGTNPDIARGDVMDDRATRFADMFGLEMRPREPGAQPRGLQYPGGML